MNTNLNLFLQESLEEEKRCKDYEGFIAVYNKSKQLFDEIAKMNCIKQIQSLDYDKQE